MSRLAVYYDWHYLQSPALILWDFSVLDSRSVIPALVTHMLLRYSCLLFGIFFCLILTLVALSFYVMAVG